MEKEIKITQDGSKLIGAVRFAEATYDSVVRLAKEHKTSHAKIVRFIVENEIDNYK